MTSPNVTEQLAEFVNDFVLDDLPAPSRDRLQLALMDSLGCALYGSQLPWVAAVRDFAANLGSADEAASGVIWGTDLRLPAANSAMVNGTAIHAFELDDLHGVGFIHPGAEIVPAVLALAEGRGDTGRRMLEAIAVGYEVGCRVGVATGSEAFQRGFHPTATSGAVGAAAAAAKLLALDREETLHAIAIGATQASGLMSVQYGASVKRWHPGKSAQAGVYAALMAPRGLTGARNALEASHGGFVAAFAPDSDPTDIIDEIGERWEINRVGFKAYACAGSSHSTIEAVRQLMEEAPIDLDRLTNVEVRLSTPFSLHVGWPYEPAGETAAQMNLPYAVAAQLVDGEVFVEQFRSERLHDPQLINLSRKVTCIADPQIDALEPTLRHTVYVAVHLEGQKPRRTEVQYRPGSPEAPLSEARLKDKFYRLATSSVSRDKADRLLTALDTLKGSCGPKALTEALTAGNHTSTNTLPPSRSVSHERLP